MSSEECNRPSVSSSLADQPQRTWKSYTLMAESDVVTLEKAWRKRCCCVCSVPTVVVRKCPLTLILATANQDAALYSRTSLYPFDCVVSFRNCPLSLLTMIN